MAAVWEVIASEVQPLSNLVVPERQLESVVSPEASVRVESAPGVGQEADEALVDIPVKVKA
jgi:hypothetical protein